MNNSIVVAVVVTYNRLNLLQRVVGALKGQSKNSTRYTLLIMVRLMEQRNGLTVKPA